MEHLLWESLNESHLLYMKIRKVIDLCNDDEEKEILNESCNCFLSQHNILCDIYDKHFLNSKQSETTK